tara:strand:- start:353 stop:559 length:207 start_codon:yes stop_codon:yes gene_type:complete
MEIQKKLIIMKERIKMDPKVFTTIEQLRDIVNGQNTYNDNLEYIEHIKTITKELTDLVGLTNIHEREN